MKAILTFMLLIFMYGCSIAPKQLHPDINKHLVYIDKRGELVNPATQKSIKNEEEVNSYINNIIGDFEKSKKKKITLFIHGGLNTFKNSTQKASQIIENYNDSESFLIFVGWQAGPYTNYLDHLLFVRNGERKPYLGIVTSPFILVEDIAESISHTPRAVTESIMSQASVPKPLIFDSNEEQAYRNSRKQLLSAPDDVKINIKMTGETTGLKLKDIIPIVNPLKFVAAPFVDGFGSGAWDSMSRRTELLIDKDSTFQGQGSSKTALEKLLSGIECESVNTQSLTMDGVQCSGNKVNQPEITLIGHSMGSMVANNILSRKPNLNYKNIVYMGAAAKIKDLEANVVPILLKNKEVKFYNLSLDPYREISESHALDSVPRGSLLIWIDTYFTRITSFSDKTAGHWFNIIRSANAIFPDQVKKQVYLTKFGFNSGPQNHGEFDEYKFWKETFWKGEEISLLKKDVQLKNKN